MGKRDRPADLDARQLRLAIVVSRYNRDIGERLLRGAESVLAHLGAPPPEVVWVPGALEVPLAAQVLAENGADGVICLGCVVKGETAHFDLVAAECAAGVRSVQLATGVPCAFGILATYNREQALARSGGEDNKGAEAAETAVEMCRLLGKLRSDPRR